MFTRRRRRRTMMMMMMMMMMFLRYRSAARFAIVVLIKAWRR